MRNQIFLCLVAAVATGCGAAAPASRPIAPSHQAGSALVTTNGIGENGIGENGIGENGIGENGIGENGIGENGIGENGDELQLLVKVDLRSAVVPGHGRVRDAQLVTSGFVAPGLTPADFVGAHFRGTGYLGETMHVRVVGHQMGAAPNSDLDTYFAERLDRSGKWVPVCADGAGNALPAVAVYGYWDFSRGTPTGGSKTESTTEFTFACPNGAIGKCIEFGYRPWSTYAAGGTPTQLAAYHQACTRMIRADYCGDGTPHTQNGETIELYDNLGIQVNDRPSWIPEAQWDPAGATCLNPSGVGRVPPVSCFSAKAKSSCGANDPSAMLSTSTELGRRIP